MGFTERTAGVPVDPLGSSGARSFLCWSCGIVGWLREWRSAEWSSMKHRISACAASANHQWVKWACQRSLGNSAAKRM
jgi:hypothetical protein